MSKNKIIFIFEKIYIIFLYIYFVFISELFNSKNIFLRC